MEIEPWDRFAAASGREPIAPPSRSAADPYMGFEEVDGGGEGESRGELTCPFCSEDFDIVDLWPHIEGEHIPWNPEMGIEPPVSDKDHEEKTRRSQFVQELMLSTIYDGSRL